MHCRFFLATIFILEVAQEFLNILIIQGHNMSPKYRKQIPFLSFIFTDVHITMEAQEQYM